MKPFLKDSTKPPFLTISRAVRRKNIPSLIEAYGRSEKLKRKTNLILILGCRDNTSKLDPQQKDLFRNIFETIDNSIIFLAPITTSLILSQTIGVKYCVALNKSSPNLC